MWKNSQEIEEKNSGVGGNLQESNRGGSLSRMDRRKHYINTLNKYDRVNTLEVIYFPTINYMSRPYRKNNKQKIVAI